MRAPQKPRVPSPSSAPPILLCLHPPLLPSCQDKRHRFGPASCTSLNWSPQGWSWSPRVSPPSSGQRCPPHTAVFVLPFRRPSVPHRHLWAPLRSSAPSACSAPRPPSPSPFVARGLAACYCSVSAFCAVLTLPPGHASPCYPAPHHPIRPWGLVRLIPQRPQAGQRPASRPPTPFDCMSLQMQEPCLVHLGVSDT